MSLFTKSVLGFAVAALFTCTSPTFAQDSPEANNSAGGGASVEGGVKATASSASQNYVSRYDVFFAPSYLSTPRFNMIQRGVNAQLGISVKRWLTIGTDFSYLRGGTNLQSQWLTPSLQQMLAPFVPPGAHVQVPFDSSALTFGAGPQVNIRRIRRVTFFAHPSGGLLQENIVLKPKDPMTTMLVSQIVPGLKKSDTTIFFGAGGGFDVNFSQHMALRFAVDAVHMKLYNNLLAGGENSVRVSIAPIFHFGRNVK